MIDLKIKKNRTKTTLRIGGDLDINNASAIKNKAVEIINEKNLEVILSKINTVDLTFIQILASLINSFSSENKKLSIKFDETEVLSNAITELGFNNHHIFKSLYKD
jgi:ABC-type transporter Mla MlaB component